MEVGGGRNLCQDEKRKGVSMGRKCEVRDELVVCRCEFCSFLFDGLLERRGESEGQKRLRPQRIVCGIHRPQVKRSNGRHMKGH